MQLCSRIRIRHQGSGAFLALGPGSGIGLFLDPGSRILDPGSQILNPYFGEVSDTFLSKSSIIL
jgi:hypothetical protein